MTNPPLSKLTGATLKSLCASCGLKKTGSKAILIHRLRHAAQHFQPLPPKSRILSIDLGLKNFAFSLLTPSPVPKSQTAPANLTTTEPFTLTSPVHLHAWHRLDLTLPISNTITTSATKNHAAITDPRNRSTTSVPNPAHPDPGNEEEEFSPAALSQLTLALVKTHLLPLQPTHVLIERQRFRTGGAAAIFEWTLRVNTLEAMLHAVFAALRVVTHEGSGGGGGRKKEGWDGTVESVLPRRVAGFLFPEGVSSQALGGDEGGVEGGKNGKRRGDGYKLLKSEKVDALGRWLKDERMVVAKTEQAREMAGLFLEGLEGRGKRKGGRKRKGEEGDEEEARLKKRQVEELMTKMDDLSDAVLQGMVWLQWQRNLERLVKERAELLENEAA
ncbi:hypothetical protein VTI74DRAFT_6295 [Chaetomium olivicolor]